MNKKIKNGKKNLLPDEISPKDVTILISIKIEGDLLDAIRARAKKAGVPYQTFIKRALREHLNL